MINQNRPTIYQNNCVHTPLEGSSGLIRFCRFLLHTDYKDYADLSVRCANCGSPIQVPTEYHHIVLKYIYLLLSMCITWMDFSLLTGLLTEFELRGELITLFFTGITVNLLFAEAFIFNRIMVAFIFSAFRWRDVSADSRDASVFARKSRLKCAETRELLRRSMSRGASISMVLFIGFPIALFTIIDAIAFFIKAVCAKKRKYIWVGIAATILSVTTFVLSVHHSTVKIWYDCLSVLVVLIMIPLESNI